MLSNKLAAQLKPFKLLVNKQALSPTYRSLKLSPGLITGCSNAVVLEASMDHGLEQTTYIDAAAFLSIMDSLPSQMEVTFTLANNVLEWVCGSAKGKLAAIVIEDMPCISAERVEAGYNPTFGFIKSLRLGALSCDSNSLLSVGMFGVVIDNRGPLTIHSSDNITVSSSIVDEGDLLDGPEIITLTPDPIELLATICMPGRGLLTFDEKTVFYQDDLCRAMIKQVPKLKYDSLSMVQNYEQSDNIAKIPPEAINSFIKRAGALAEHKRETHIELSTSNGKLSLSFAEGVASAEEFYLVDGLDIPEMAPVVLDAARLARALSNVSEVVLDHVSRSVLVLRGSDPDFSYLIAGRK